MNSSIRKLLLIIFLLILNLSYSQIKNGKIHYRVSIDVERNIKEIEAMSISPGVKARLLDSYRNAKPVQLVLTFQTDLAFNEGEIDLNNLKTSNTMLVQSGAKKQTYTTQNPHSILTTGGLMGAVLTEENLPVWELVDETKQIGDYSCYKARGYILGEGNSGQVKKEFEAWYTPDIPVQFGPYVYSGLPGLVLQVNFDDDLLFEATEIILNLPDLKEIQLPDLKIISRQEANQKLKGYLRN